MVPQVRSELPPGSTHFFLVGWGAVAELEQRRPSAGVPGSGLSSCMRG